MKINFNDLPTERPSQFDAMEPGDYVATIKNAEMVTSPNTGNTYLKVTFVTEDNQYVNENYFEPNKPFLKWKLNNLIKACGLELEGEGSLQDLIKLIKNKKVIIDVIINDKGYSAIDYSDNKQGVSPATELEADIKAAVEDETPAEPTQATDDDF